MSNSTTPEIIDPAASALPATPAHTRTRSLITAALIAALMATSSWIAGTGAVPITLQTFFVVFAAVVLRPRWAAASMALYVLLGIVGLPVFAGATAGPAVLAGPSGGYLIGFIVAAPLCSLIFHIDSDNRAIRIATSVIGIVASILLIDGLGTIWLAISLQMGFFAAVAAGIVPFLVGDALKALVAVLVGRYLARALWAGTR
ncbi:MAG: biotin transporter BioY [Actinomycetes bacterium]|jgi:biotin transport system substrate-specific component|nr:biotin transporter BioY [Actinomycetes bacterium]